MAPGLPVRLLSCLSNSLARALTTDCVSSAGLRLSTPACTSYRPFSCDAKPGCGSESPRALRFVDNPTDPSTLVSPSTYLLRSLIGTFRSCSFLASFVALFQGLVCLQRHFYNRYHGVVPEWLEKIVMHKSYYWFSGCVAVSLPPFASSLTRLVSSFATCLPLFLEERKRRRELAMYVLPRGLESFWSILRRRKWVPFVPGGEVLLTWCVHASRVGRSNGRG